MHLYFESYVLYMFSYIHLISLAPIPYAIDTVCNGIEFRVQDQNSMRCFFCGSKSLSLETNEG